MPVPTTNDPELTTTAVVTIRVPCGADGDLVTDAETRLSRAGPVDGVTIDGLRAIDPKLSATVITVGITVRWSTRLTDTAARERLAEVSGVESIERIE